MTRQIVTHTQQAFVLSLNIVTQANNEFTVSSIPIVRLTTLIMLIWTTLTTINQLHYSLNYRLTIANIVIGIVITSIAWGVLQNSPGCYKTLLQNLFRKGVQK